MNRSAGQHDMSHYKKFIAVGDNHGSLASKDATKKLFSFIDAWDPNYRIHLGDVWDMCPLRGNASDSEKAEGISVDYREGMDFIDRYKPHYLTLGNHDARLWETGEKAKDGILRERCAELASATEDEFRKRRIKWVPYHVNRYLQMPEGGPKLLHGFRATMYPARNTHDNWGPSLSGHVHKPDTYVARHVDGDMAMTTGCLADIDKLTYADRTPAKLAWRMGWIYGILHAKSGKWSAWHVIKENGVWVSPMGVL